MVKIPSAGVLYYESEFVCPQAGPLRRWSQPFTWCSAWHCSPFSYGAVQVRVAEALCLLPVFGPEYIAGVVLGCFLANLLGSTIVDVIFGTLATLLACLVTYKLRDLRFKGLGSGASPPAGALQRRHHRH